jgi:hypothetical protein
MGLYETKKLLHKKNGYQIKEAACRMEEIFARYPSDKGLITRIYRELKILSSPKYNDPMKKRINELNEQSFFKVRSQNGQKNTQRNAQHPGHRGNANQNHVKIPPHSC